MRVDLSRYSTFFKLPALKQDGGKLYFVEPVQAELYEKALTRDMNSFKKFLKRWPGLYYFLLYFASTIFFIGLSVKGALRKAFPAGFHNGKIILNVGSGPRTYPHLTGIINVDAHPFSNVDIVADVTNLPFKDGVADMVIAESLLEHVPEVGKAVSEISRVIKPGGYVYAMVPFLYPFHESPGDYYRWTMPGWKHAFPDFEVVDSGARSGPMSAILSILMHYFAIVLSFGQHGLYLVLVNIFMVVLMPFKVLDVIFKPFPQTIDAAAFIYFLGKKHGKETL